MKAIIHLDVPDWQIGQPVTVYFPDTMQKKGVCMEETIEYNNTLNAVLSERFFIPCDLCSEYFSKNGDCPSEITKCNSKEHWGMLIERIQADEKD